MCSVAGLYIISFLYVAQILKPHNDEEKIPSDKVYQDIQNCIMIIVSIL